MRLLHGRIGEGRHDRGVELGDDVLRRALGRPQPVPERNLHAGHADLVHGRNIGQRRPARLRHHGEGLHLAAAHMRQRLRGLGAHQVDLAGDQVLHRRRAAAIGHELEAACRSSPGNRGRRYARRCRRRRSPAEALSGIGLEPGDQLLGVLGRQRGLADDHQRGRAELRDRLEIGQHVPRAPGRARAAPTWLVQLPTMSV